MTALNWTNSFKPKWTKSQIGNFIGYNKSDQEEKQVQAAYIEKYGDYATTLVDGEQCVKTIKQKYDAAVGQMKTKFPKSILEIPSISSRDPDNSTTKSELKTSLSAAGLSISQTAGWNNANQLMSTSTSISATAQLQNLPTTIVPMPEQTLQPTMPMPQNQTIAPIQMIPTEMNANVPIPTVPIQTIRNATLPNMPMPTAPIQPVPMTYPMFNDPMLINQAVLPKTELPRYDGDILKFIGQPETLAPPPYAMPLPLLANPHLEAPGEWK